MFLRLETFSDIELRDQARPKLGLPKKYHIQFSVGDRLLSTKNARKKKNRISWDDVLYLWIHIQPPYTIKLTLVSDGDDRTAFLVTVYKKKDISFTQPEVVVGSLTDTIGGILTKSQNGGTKILCIRHVLLTRTLAIKVFELPLGGVPSDGPVRPGIAIKFAVTSEPHGDVDANKLQATDAVKNATEEISAFRPTPQIVGQVNLAIGTGTKVVTELQTFENTWNVLLKRMALFNKIVGGIAEVSGIRRLSPSSSECRIDSSIYVVGLVCDIGCEPGLCVARCSH